MENGKRRKMEINQQKREKQLECVVGKAEN